MTFEHEAHTDVMYADVSFPSKDADIEVVDIGGPIGFPEGHVLARIDRTSTVLLGLTIHEYSSFKRRLMRKFGIWSVKMGIQLLVDAVGAGLQTGNRAHAVCA